jgi:hypothetical protein
MRDRYIYTCIYIYILYIRPQNAWDIGPVSGCVSLIMGRCIRDFMIAVPVSPCSALLLWRSMPSWKGNFDWNCACGTNAWALYVISKQPFHWTCLEQEQVCRAQDSMASGMSASTIASFDKHSAHIQVTNKAHPVQTWSRAPCVRESDYPA